MDEGNIEHICKELLNERRKQYSKWGDQDHSFPTWISILTEEVGESAREANDFHFSENKIARKELLEDLRKELLQTAAVAIQIIEKIDEYEKA